MSKTISEEEAFSQLETMFPGYERSVLSDFLDSNNGNLSRTIEQLLKINAEEAEVKTSAQVSQSKDRKSVGSASTASTGLVKNETAEDDFKSAFDSDNESPEVQKNPKEENQAQELTKSLIYDEMLAATLQQEEVKDMDDEMVIDQAIRNSLFSLDSDEVTRVKDFERRAHLFFKKVHMGFDEYKHEVLHEEIIHAAAPKGMKCVISARVEKKRRKLR